VPLSGRRVVVAFNPTAGAGGRQTKIAALQQRLEQCNLEVSICPDADCLAEVVREAASGGDLRCVVAAGGDGTVSHVANRLPADTPLAVFPLGTENLLSGYLGQTSDVEAMCRTLNEGQVVGFDAGEVGGRLFTLMAGCGFDAEVVDRLHRARRGNIWHGAYVQPILRTIGRYAYPALTVHVAGPVEESIVCRWVFIVNVPRYAFGLSFDPDASPHDGLLNVVTFRDGSLLRGLNYVAQVFAGTHKRRSDVCVRLARSVRVESESSTRYQLDGDPGGDLPLAVQCVPGRLKLVVRPEFLAARRKP
jgi:diacylglycerol kinase family enzyme